MSRRTRTVAPRLHLEALEDRCLLDAGGLPGPPTFPSPEIDPTSIASDRILVRFRGDVDPDAESSSLLPGTSLGRAFDLVPDLYEVRLNAGANAAAALAAYRADPRVLYAEADVRLRLSVVPNDPSFGSLWGMQNTGQSGGTADADIDAPEAWNVTMGGGRIVAVIDTGIDYTHPDLQANMWVNAGEVAGNGLDDDGNGFIDDARGWDFANNDNNPTDDNGHGTHVAGTIGAVGNNGIGVAGVAWNVRLMPLKFLDASGSGYLSDAIKALDYARLNGATIANNSWGGGGYTQALADAIERARQAGVIVVAAAGNAGQNNDLSPSYPASYGHDNVVAVAASDRDDRLASFSNYGTTSVDIAAPGVSILSTVPGGYATYNGTSMAAPHVSGALALVWDRNPTWTYRQVIDQLLHRADPVLKDKVAWGRLNVAAALNNAPTDVEGPRVTGAVWSGMAAESIDRVRLTFNAAINAATFTADDVTLAGPGGGPITPVGVTRVSDTQFDVTFAAQSAPGTYALSVGPAVQDQAGNAMDQDGDGTPGEAADDRYTTTHAINGVNTYTWAGPAPISDGLATVAALKVSDNFVIADLNVKVDISHTYDADLRIYLIDPTGASRLLMNRRGGSGDNVHARFDDEATVLIRNGRAPFDGSYRPENALSVYDGKGTAGTWSLRVEDGRKGNTGQLNSWSLVIQARAEGAGAQVPDLPAVGRGPVREPLLPTLPAQASPQAHEALLLAAQARQKVQQALALARRASAAGRQQARAVARQALELALQAQDLAAGTGPQDVGLTELVLALVRQAQALRRKSEGPLGERGNRR